LSSILNATEPQIVHPNFFSWAAVRTLFWHGLVGDAAQHQALSVLQANFRNTRAVTDLANSLLKIKQTRFGSIDRESNFLVKSASSQDGQVRLVPARTATLRELDTQTRASVHHAVIVLRDEDKPAAREHFCTPLVFSVHEAKGLEYSHVLLYALVSGQRAAYAEVCNGVTQADLQTDVLAYRRARDKGDKSLEFYKFYVNALYVAMTRAVESLVLVESDTTHPFQSARPACHRGLDRIAGANLVARRMGARGTQARAARQGRTGTRHPRNLPADQTRAVGATV
jgi:ATP-dependent exoDNAse (exonuclease V) beta subunit